MPQTAIAWLMKMLTRRGMQIKDMGQAGHHLPLRLTSTWGRLELAAVRESHHCQSTNRPDEVV